MPHPMLFKGPIILTPDETSFHESLAIKSFPPNYKTRSHMKYSPIFLYMMMMMIIYFKISLFCHFYSTLRGPFHTRDPGHVVPCGTLVMSHPIKLDSQIAKIYRDQNSCKASLTFTTYFKKQTKNGWVF